MEWIFATVVVLAVVLWFVSPWALLALVAVFVVSLFLQDGPQA